jgi:hypothetical protein
MFDEFLLVLQFHNLEDVTELFQIFLVLHLFVGIHLCLILGPEAWVDASYSRLKLDEELMALLNFPRDGVLDLLFPLFRELLYAV